LLLIFSWRPIAEIEELVAAHAAAPQDRKAQRALAEDFTVWVHGAEAARRAVAASQIMFGGSLESATDADLEALVGEVPGADLPLARLDAGVPILDLLVETGLTPSKGEARRKIGQGGIYLNQVRVEAPDLVLSPSSRATDSFLLLRSGKKDYRLVRVR
jgi:tyrosyl-tRNA synthetase